LRKKRTRTIERPDSDTFLRTTVPVPNHKERQRRIRGERSQGGTEGGRGFAESKTGECVRKENVLVFVSPEGDYIFQMMTDAPVRMETLKKILGGQDCEVVDGITGNIVRHKVQGDSEINALFPAHWGTVILCNWDTKTEQASGLTKAQYQMLDRHRMEIKKCQVI
jgi:hypothetical protein